MLVFLHVMADRGGTLRIVADRHQNMTNRREHDLPRNHHADQIADRNEAIHRPAAGDLDGRETEIKGRRRSEEHTSELQSLIRISYAVFCLTQNNQIKYTEPHAKDIDSI